MGRVEWRTHHCFLLSELFGLSSGASWCCPDRLRFPTALTVRWRHCYSRWEFLLLIHRCKHRSVRQGLVWPALLVLQLLGDLVSLYCGYSHSVGSTSIGEVLPGLGSLISETVSAGGSLCCEDSALMRMGNRQLGSVASVLEFQCSVLKSYLPSPLCLTSEIEYGFQSEMLFL